QFAEITAASQETSSGALAMSEISGKDFQLAKAYELFNGLPFFRLIFVFIFYFIGGYLLYSALFAAVGSLVNDDGGDVQMYTFPVMLPIIISIILMMVVIQQPHSSLAFWASIFPLTSPIVMPARVPFLNGFSWELILSMVLLVIGFISATWFAGRVYRTGILLYGKKPSPKEIWKWLWY
ncbi:MAG: ABC-2 type transport system permease protein, partial [Limisphaerales bacterium]